METLNEVAVLVVFRLLAVSFCNFHSVFGNANHTDMSDKNYSASDCHKLRDDLISSNPTDIKFYLYSSRSNPYFEIETKNNVVMEELQPWNLTLLQNSRYNSSLSLKVLIHGFMSNSTDAGGFNQRIVRAYLEEGTSANLVSVDWGPLSTVKDRLPLMQYYAMAASNVKVVGSLVAEMIIFLIQSARVSGPEQVHLIGFSLGAHVSGIAGYQVLQNVSHPVQRITGLDPAGPYFQKVGRGQRLDSTDANFVDVYHSNQGHNGYRGNLGHVDFYPNGGGPKQPSCANITEPVRFLAGICAHGLAYKYFAKSIRVRNITACKCNHLVDVSCKSFHSCSGKSQETTIFGEECPQSARGEFYLSISEKDSPNPGPEPTP